jgi:parallel beta-helix repeat protein
MSSATQSETITAAPADRLVFTTGARTVGAGVCSPVLTVQSRDSFGNPAPAPASTPVALVAAPATGFTFFLDAACTAAGSPTLSAGASAASFYFRGTAAGTVAVSATASTWTPANQSEVVLAGAPASLVWDPIASPQAMGTPSGVRLVAQDAHGNPATTFAGTATLSIAPGSTVQCSTSCTNTTTTGAFSAGVWSGSVTFGAPAGTGRTLTATSGALSGTSNAFDLSNYPARSPPVARFTRTPAVVAPNATVAFDAASSTDYQTATSSLEVAWDFSGVAVTTPPAAPWTAWTTTKTATTTYATAGVYSPRLAVRDAAGDIGYATLPVEVIAAANTCVVNINTMTDDGASSCSAVGPDGRLSLVEALRVTGSMAGRQAITFSGPMTITGASTLVMRDVDVIAPSGVLLNTLSFEVPNGTSSRLSGVEMFGQTSPLVVRNGGTLVVTDDYLHDMIGISLEAGAAGQVVRTRMTGCALACVSQNDTGSSPLLVRASTFADSAHPGVFMMAGNGAGPVLEVYGNVFIRMAIGVLNWAAAPVRIRNNTFHGNTTGLVFSSGTNEDVRNNIFTSNTTSASCGSATFAFRDRQVLYGNTSDGCLTAGTNTLTGDPLYQFLSGDDYRLQWGSPAVDSAASLGLDLNDSAPGLYFGAGPDRGGWETW